MPNFDIVRKSQPSNSFRVASILGMYDLDATEIKEHFCGNLDLPENWQIGLIVGASGTGKTSIAKELFPAAYYSGGQFTGASVIDDFNEHATISDISKILTDVGFSSVPSWLKPYSVLSNGEKMRVDIARALLEPKNLIVFDEFTSVVDRTVAKICANSVQKAVRRSAKQFIAVSCHYDIEDWLCPDWVFDTNSMEFRLFPKKKGPISDSNFSRQKKEQDFGQYLGVTII